MTNLSDRSKTPVLSPHAAGSLRHPDKGFWAAGWATTGAASWAGIALLARMRVARLGIIELMFLLAPLVIVPLGMELVRVSDGRTRATSRRAGDLAQVLQPLGAVSAVVAIWLAPGPRAALIALGWMIVCALAAASGVFKLLGMVFARAFPVAQVALAVAQIDLAVGGAWLVASRLGLRPMGIQEPIGLLTAVHFHFAGFATAAIAAATLRLAERQGDSRWLRRIVMLVIFMPFVVAAGFVTAPLLKMTAAILFSLGVVALATSLWKCAGSTEDATARWFLRVAPLMIFLGMVLSSAYAIVDFLGSDRLPIPRMASTHGVINAVGFCLPALLGWLIESHRRPAPETAPDTKTEDADEREEVQNVR